MVDEAQNREALQARIVARRQTVGASGGHLPQPPYHLRGVDMLYLQCRFDPAQVATIVPAGLNPSANGWGVIGFYTVSEGWGIAPYSALYLGVEVDDDDSPDGSPANYMHSGFFSDVGGRVMTEVYNTNFRIGWSRLMREGEKVVAEAGIGDRIYIRARCRVSDGPSTTMNGVSRYIGRRPGGGYNSYSVAFTLEGDWTTDHSVEFLDGAAEVLEVIRPVSYEWPILIHNMDMAFTPPRSLSDRQGAGGEARTADLAGLFNRFGRPAAILAGDGTVLSLNGEAHALMTSGRLAVSGGLISTPSRDARASFHAAIQSALRRGDETVSDRVALPVADGGLPLLAQTLALDVTTAGPGRLLVFFDDPMRDIASDPGPVLQLLGLTPAEARVAGLVGAGRSPREVADQLDLTINTVRSALKIAFDKLGISRQSELAKIVARLAG